MTEPQPAPENPHVPGIGLNKSAPQPGDVEWTAPPPGSSREQLTDQLLALIDVPDYTSTACEAARECEGAAARHVEHADQLHTAAGQLHQRCRVNNKFTGVLCNCSCHPR